MKCAYSLWDNGLPILQPIFIRLRIICRALGLGNLASVSFNGFGEVQWKVVEEMMQFQRARQRRAGQLRTVSAWQNADDSILTEDD